MRDYFFLTLIVAGLPVILFRPFFGLIMWCWVAYMLPHKLGWGIIAHYPVAAMVGGLALLAWLVSKEPKKLPINAIVVVYLLMLLWWLVSFLANERTPYAINQFDKVMKIQLFTVLTMILVNSKARLDALVAVISLSIAFFGIKGGFFTIITGGGERVWGPPSGFFEGNNELGLTLLTILPFLYYLKTQMHALWQKYALIGAMLLCFVAAIGTHSRGALIAAVAMSAFFWWRSDKKVVLGFSAVLFLGVLYVFMPSNWHERMATMKVTDQEAAITHPIDTSTWCGRLTAKVQASDRSAGGRVNAWCYAFNRANSSIIGAGFNAFNPAAFQTYAPDPYDFHDAHSIYFKILGEHGYIGIVLFLTLMLLAFFRTSHLRKLAIAKKIDWAVPFASMLQVAMISFGTGGLFLGLCYFDLLYHLVAMVVILDVLVHKHVPHATTHDVVPMDQDIPRFANSLPAFGGRE